MSTLGNAAKEYQPAQMKNISELPEVSTQMTLYDGEGIGDNGEPYKYKYVEINGEKYRVPFVVLGQIKDLIEQNSAITRFKIKKSGEGLKTRYSVVPLM